MVIRYKKGQSALEFLTTYGWAFLVILIMIGALAYFGVLDPSRFLPDRCDVPTGFVCNGVVADPTTGIVQIALLNSIGKSVNVVSDSVAVTTDPGTTCTFVTEDAIIFGGVEINGSSSVAGPTTWSSQVEEILSFTCDAITDGSRFDSAIEFEYQVAGSSLTKTMAIDVSFGAN